MRERPGDPGIHSSLGVVYAGLGRKAEAIREGELSVELYPVSKDALGAPFRALELAHIYVMVGEHESALDQIDYLLSIPNIWLSLSLLRLDPWWDPLREHSRYKRLLEKSSGE